MKEIKEFVDNLLYKKECYDNKNKKNIHNTINVENKNCEDIYDMINKISFKHNYIYHNNFLLGYKNLKIKDKIIKFLPTINFINLIYKKTKHKKQKNIIILNKDQEKEFLYGKDIPNIILRTYQNKFYFILNRYYEIIGVGKLEEKKLINIYNIGVMIKREITKKKINK